MAAMDRPHRRTWPAWLALLLIGVAACGGTNPSPSGSPSATASSATARPSASVSIAPSATASPSVALTRSGDLDLLLDRLRTIHPNPFLEEGETSFVARLEALRASADGLTDVGFTVGVMRLMGNRPRDGHSGAWAMAQPGTTIRALPLWLWEFPDGPRIVAAQPPLDDLIGARVTHVGHATIDEARAAVAPLVPRDNDSTLRGNLPIYLTLPDVAVELGLRTPGEPALTVELPDGSIREIDVEPVPIETMRDWIFEVYGGDYPDALPPDEDGPLVRRDIANAFWSTPLDGGGLYVAYNAITRTNAAGETIGSLEGTIRAASADADARLIVDLRNDGGGDNHTYGGMLGAVESFARDHPGRVALITGRGTFSAAGNFVTQLDIGEQRDAIHLVGEPPGGGLDMYGDVDVVTLPASRVVVLISTEYHEIAPGDDRLAVEPDIPIELTWADYAAGRDPVFDAAIEATSGD
jgi:hypothetical protein